MDNVVYSFFDRFAGMINSDPAQALLLIAVVLVIGFVLGRWHASHLVTVSNERVQFLKDRLAEKAGPAGPDRELEMKRIEAELAKQARLSEKQKMYPPRKR